MTKYRVHVTDRGVSPSLPDRPVQSNTTSPPLGSCQPWRCNYYTKNIRSHISTGVLKDVLNHGLSELEHGEMDGTAVRGGSLISHLA